MITGDSTSPSVIACTRELTCSAIPLIIADPPYGNVINQSWDKTTASSVEFSDWMLSWTASWSAQMADGGAMYVWGGYGRPGFRPYFRYLHEVEYETDLQAANFIIWSKKRAFGISWGYLETREDCVYLVKGDRKKPRVFNVPLLDQKRGYPGYNPKYPAKSEYLRRTSVWTDITEILRGKKHPAQKQQRLHEIMIETSSRPGDWVVDPFAGYGTTAFAARALGRPFVMIESDFTYATDMIDRLTAI